MSGNAHPIVQKELALQLDQIQVLGVSLWRLIRVPVLEAYMASRGAWDRPNHNRVPANRIPNILLGVVRSLLHVMRLRRRPFLVLGFPRRRFEDEEWVDPFSDPVIDFLGAHKVLCVEKPFVGEHCRPPRTRGIVYYDWVTALALVTSSIGFFVPWIIFRREIAELTSRVSDIAGTSARRTGLLAARAIVRFWIERAAARGLLAVVRPRAVLLTIRRHHYPLIYACKVHGIPVYELQHGAITEGGFRGNTPYNSHLDPDALLTFGRYWNAADWGLPAEAIKCIGFKYIWDKKMRLTRPFALLSNKVMLVSQPHISRSLGAAFSSIVEAYPNAHFILKLHPQDVGRWWDRYPFANEANVEVHADSAPDLYSLFTECHCVIGYDSTVLFEASFFGLKVGILNQDGANRCSALKFAGRYNFHEIRDIRQIADLLRLEPNPADSGDNPFFAAFDEAQFLRLMEHDACTSAWPAEERVSC